MSMSKACKHKTSETIHIACYMGSVAHYPYTEENRAAHGGVCITEECVACGARREVNTNGRHYEYGTWGPTRREAAERLS